MNQPAQTITRAEPQSSLVAKVASKFGVDPNKMMATLKATAFKGEREVTNEQMMALLVVANEYNLNPWLKEIYAFPDKNGGIVPIVGFDGWVRIINERPELDYFEFAVPAKVEGKPYEWVGCTIKRKDRSKPVYAEEFLEECRRETAPWKSHPRRMLRHKALIQAARLAFGFGGIYDPDEGERIRDAINVSASTARTGAIAGPVTSAEPPTPAEGYESWLADMGAVAETGEANFEAAWKNSPENFRTYLATYDPTELETLKAMAADTNEPAA